MGYPATEDDRGAQLLLSANSNHFNCSGADPALDADDADGAIASVRRGGGVRVRGCIRTSLRWIDELRESLRGRRLFTLFALVNLVNYVDRGVVPGGSEEFNVFISRELHTGRPDVFLGVLQSAFILGFSLSCLFFARMANFHSPFSLMSAGLGVWCASTVMAGLARPLESYFFLLFARLLSGVGEASFVTVVPPLITETAPPGERGVWLAIFYTAMPVGAGVGYVYGSVLSSSSLGWQWAFYLEALVMAPLAIACGLVPRDEAMAVPNSADYGCCVLSSSHASEATTPKHNKSSPAELNSISYRGSGGDIASTNNSTSNASSSSFSSLASSPPPGIPPGQSAVLPLKDTEEAHGQRPRRRRVHVSRPGSGSESRGSTDEEHDHGNGYHFVEEEVERGDQELPRDVRRGVIAMGAGAEDEALMTNMGTSNSRGPDDRNGGAGGGDTGRRRGRERSPSFSQMGASSALGRSGEERLGGGEEVDGQGEEGKHPGPGIVNLYEEQEDGEDEQEKSSYFYLGSINAGSKGRPLPLPRRPPVVVDHDRIVVQRRRDCGSDNEHVSFPTHATTTTTTHVNGTTRSHHPNLVGDLQQVLDRPIFALVVFGAAANAAVTAGMSTFGTGFITALELLHTETAAAATFGVIICAAGLVGTPAGGALIDAADPEGRLVDEKKLEVVMRQAMWLVCGATVVLVVATAQSSLLPFLVLFFVGAVLLFSYTPHINLAVMLAAPAHLRPLAIAINSVMLHVLGDVPSPTVVGAIKDALAPHCVASSSNHDNVVHDMIHNVTAAQEQHRHQYHYQPQDELQEPWPIGHDVQSSPDALLAGLSMAKASSARFVDGVVWTGLGEGLETVESPSDEAWGSGQGIGGGVGEEWREMVAATAGAGGVGGQLGREETRASLHFVGGISDACRSERAGLHLTLFIVSSWLLWACLCFYLAKVLQRGGNQQGTAPVRWGDICGLFAKFWAYTKRTGRRLTGFCRIKTKSSRISTSGTRDNRSCLRRGAWKLGLRSGRSRSRSHGMPSSSSYELHGGEDSEGVSSLEQPLLFGGGGGQGDSPRNDSSV